MSECRTCKHWKKIDNDEGLDFGECNAPVMFWNSDKTFRDGSQCVGGGVHIPQKGNTHIKLSTIPEFACVQHESDEKVYAICCSHEIIGIFNNTNAAQDALLELGYGYEIREYYLNK